MREETQNMKGRNLKEVFWEVEARWTWSQYPKETVLIVEKGCFDP